LFGPGSQWDADYYPIVILTELLTTKAGRWNGLTLNGHDRDFRAELDELIEIMDYRPGVNSEALAQANGIVTYFRGIFSFTASSHPMTYALAMTAIRVGEFLAMYYKAQHNRPRPSRLSARLMPLVEVPGHASFPSGHATQSRLVANLLAQVIEGAEAPLLCMADRIARNREVMGLHYRSDSEGGVDLANKAFHLLFELDTMIKMINRARSEWGLQPLPQPKVG